MKTEKPSASTGLAFACVTTLFFAWGFITSLIDPLVASVKGIFSLSDVEAQLSASAFFIAYGVMSLPAAALLARRKSVTTVLIALALMVAGCVLMLLATNLSLYPLVLFGLFVLASGITILQVAANPLAAGLGRPDRSHLRLTFSQALNSLGTFIGPYLGASLFLKGVEIKEGQELTASVRAAALTGIDFAFLLIAMMIVVLALFIWSSRRLIASAAPTSPTQSTGGIAAMLREATSSRWALLGGGAIFLYVGAEVAIGTQMALFLHSDAVLGVSLEQAGKMVSLYWGGAMIGRLVGAALLARMRAPALLGGFAAIACAICLFVVMIGGAASGYAALSIGLFNSIMFPVIFTLTLERSTASQEATSGFLCFSIVGGAAVPLLVGLVSGATSYATAFIVPAICYALLLGFALAAGRVAANRSSDATSMAGH
ncbi:MFS transporter [Novosphingobium sp. MW5]|nr:MFS transporter [Novosphingobium sp. MW5]